MQHQLLHTYKLLNVLGVINDTTAAAIAYGFEMKLEAERNVLIFDPGGSCLDVSVVSMDQSYLFRVFYFVKLTRIFSC